MSKSKKPQTPSYKNLSLRLQQASQNAKNTYHRPRENMGVLHRRHK